MTTIPRIAKAQIRGSTEVIDLLRIPTPNGPSGNWDLVFADEFSGTELDKTKWNVYSPTTGTLSNPDNVTVADSIISMKLSSTTEGITLTSALLETNLVSEFDPGEDFFRVQVGDYAEAKMWYPGDGTHLYNWNTFWLSGLDWPTNGEHDIIETHNDATISYHYGSIGQDNTNPAAYVPPGYWGDAWHTFGLERLASSANVYYDGQLVKSYATHDNGGGQAIIIGTGYSASYNPKVGESVLADYVRVFRPAE